MNKREVLTKLEVNALAIGGFVTGIVYKTPELSVFCLAVNGISFMSSLPQTLQYLDWQNQRAEVIAEAERITADAVEN